MKRVWTYRLPGVPAVSDTICGTIKVGWSIDERGLNVAHIQRELTKAELAALYDRIADLVTQAFHQRVTIWIDGEDKPPVAVFLEAMDMEIDIESDIEYDGRRRKAVNSAKTKPRVNIESAPCSAVCPQEPDWLCNRTRGHAGRHESASGGDWHDAPSAGVAGDACTFGNECGRTGCPECQQ